MLIFDICLHIFWAYGLISILKVIPTYGERLGLSFLFAFALKSIEIFFLLILGLKLNPINQFLVVWVGLGFTLIVYLKISNNWRKSNNYFLQRYALRYLLITILILGVLTFYSIKNALFFPITEPDGIWYQLRGIVYFYESDFNSSLINPQYRAYPPFLSLIYVWILSFKGQQFTWLFPIFYLLLLIIFFYRVRASSSNFKLASVLVLVLGTTPYFWWHSVQPVLNLIAGTFYALGLVYFFELVEACFGEYSFNLKKNNFAIISGICFGMSAWTRPEFILYSALPMAILIYLVTQSKNFLQKERSEILPKFMVPGLGIPSIWYLWMNAFIEEIPFSSLGMSILCLSMWFLFVAALLNLVPKSKNFWLGGIVFSGFSFFVALWFPSKTELTPFSALGMGIFRTIGFQIFFMFTSGLLALIFIQKWSELSISVKMFCWLLLGYITLHFVLYTLLPMRSGTVVQYFDNPFISLGDAVNSPDTRELLAIYPAFLFLISLFPSVRRSFK